ncbi:MAG: hypothetical protein DMG22_09400 [Acidobacteria bacterium]|nr:MAG: hypothetical protein DMG22_09400 [Acidobacteriota bacterium]
MSTCQNYISVKPKLHGSYKYEHCCVNKFAEWISSIEFRLRRMFSVGVQSSGLLPYALTVASRRSDHPKKLQFRMFTALLVIQPTNLVH